MEQLNWVKFNTKLKLIYLLTFKCRQSFKACYSKEKTKKKTCSSSVMVLVHVMRYSVSHRLLNITDKKHDQWGQKP